MWSRLYCTRFEVEARLTIRDFPRRKKLKKDDPDKDCVKRGNDFS